MCVGCVDMGLSTPVRRAVSGACAWVVYCLTDVLSLPCWMPAVILDDEETSSEEEDDDEEERAAMGDGYDDENEGTWVMD